MSARFLILVMFLTTLVPLARPQQSSAPLTRDQIMDLVKFGMSSSDLEKRIEEHGIDFEPTDDYLDALRKAGAQEAVIQALRQLKPKPLSQEQVGKLVAGGVSSQRALTLVKQRGIDFTADEKYLQTLRLAGADDNLIAALRQAGAAVTAELAVATLPGAKVLFDSQLQGRTDAQCELTIKASPGTHVLKIIHSGKKAFEQNVTLVGGETTHLQVTLVDLGESTAEPGPGRTICVLAEQVVPHWQPVLLALRALQHSSLLQPTDWVAVIAFTMRPQIISDFSRGTASTWTALESLQPPGFSEINLNDGLSFTLDRMKAIKGQKGVILICSGVDTFSKRDDSGLFEIVKASDTPVYAISVAALLDPGIQAGLNLDQARNKLDNIANLSKGHAFFPRSASELSSVYDQLGMLWGAM
ncbi:MAG TPA: hypothetical protein VMO17_18525 [Terriglobia bacterium]|nr:hypothetical protein [Terriglobia bacterium]